MVAIKRTTEWYYKKQTKNRLANYETYWSIELIHRLFRRLKWAIHVWEIKIFFQNGQNRTSATLEIMAHIS